MADQDPTQPAPNAAEDRDPLLIAMWNRLPEVGTEFPTQERDLWLAAMKAVLALVYAERDVGG